MFLNLERLSCVLNSLNILRTESIMSNDMIATIYYKGVENDKRGTYYNLWVAEWS